jgi:S-adenosylmethionine:tRNA-ribosyltransferase-isomerase (queuine synthetase)
MSTPFSFHLPAELSAKEPPERRGIACDSLSERLRQNDTLLADCGMPIYFSPQLKAIVEERDLDIPRLWKLRFSQSGTELIDSFYQLGQSIRYEYVSAPWDLEYYQTVYAKEPGSSEMPSARRAFT